jgi:ribosomal protein L4
VYDILNHDQLVLTRAAVEALEARIARAGRKGGEGEAHG